MGLFEGKVAVIAGAGSVTTKASVGVCADALGQLGRIDPVLNAAGISGTRPLADITMESYDTKAALKRAGESQEIAEVAVSLVSDKASFVTGAIVPVDGGWSARLA